MPTTRIEGEIASLSMKFYLKKKKKILTINIRLKLTEPTGDNYNQSPILLADAEIET